MISYSQRDIRWANARMGQSSLTIGRYGCTTSCMADLSTYFGDNLTPLQLSQTIKYTSDGLVLWQSCKFPHFEFWFRQYGRNEVDIKNALADPKLAVILQVANGSHWVVATGAPTLFNRYFRIADPWDGFKTDMRKYGNSITGAAYFKKVEN